MSRVRGDVFDRRGHLEVGKMQCLRATLPKAQFSNQPARYFEPPVVSRRRTTVALLLFFTPYRPEKANGFSRFSRACPTGRIDLADATPGSSPGSPSTRRPFRLLTAAYTNYRESLCTESFCLGGKDRREARPTATLPLRMRRSKCLANFGTWYERSGRFQNGRHRRCQSFCVLCRSLGSGGGTRAAIRTEDARRPTMPLRIFRLNGTERW